MPFTLTVKSANDAAKQHREAAGHRVVDCFKHEFRHRRLLCFFDDEEWVAFKTKNGAANRGFYSRVTPNDEHWRIAPAYILEQVFSDRVPAIDDFIYLHGSTCTNDVGLTMTFAHELQHFVQRSERTELWAANALVPNLPKTAINALRLRWCDIPHEREARIVSKRIAEQLFGGELVRQYIAARVEERVTEGDAVDWECIQRLATSIPYDLARETGLFFPKLKDYRTELERALRALQSNDEDFAHVDLAALIRGTSE